MLERRGNEFRDLSPIELQERFLMTWDMFWNKESIDRLVGELPQVAIRSFHQNRPGTEFNKALLRKMDALVSKARISKYFKEELRKGMITHARFGVDRDSQAEKWFLATVTHTPEFDEEGELVAAHLDPQGGIFDKTNSWQFESRALNLERMRFERKKDSIDGATYNINISNLVTWRDSYRERHHRLPLPSVY